MTGLETALAIGGSLLSAVGSVAGGISAKQNADAQADAAERQANEARAVSQREAVQRSKEAKLLISRQQALAAASGGGATDPSVLTNTGEIGKQGWLNSQTALYEGESQGRALEDSAAIGRWQGRKEMFAGFVDAGSTTLNGLGGFAKNRRLNTFPAVPSKPKRENFWPEMSPW
ncbi:hypothetical protein ACSBOB_11590 [Mesorhizobium sp. ASY16-5R]|uniref:hypothetical protein n=1 Tax=Mesorhizobium sp. ASY16-5R TaxID=3445772 RepID=UPI003F9FDC7F